MSSLLALKCFSFRLQRWHGNRPVYASSNLWPLGSQPRPLTTTSSHLHSLKCPLYTPRFFTFFQTLTRADLVTPQHLKVSSKRHLRLMQRIYKSAHEFMRSYTRHAHNKVKIKASDWVATVGSGTKVWIQCRSIKCSPMVFKTPGCEHINLSLNFTGFSPTSGGSFWKTPCVANANLATTH